MPRKVTRTRRWILMAALGPLGGLVACEPTPAPPSSSDVSLNDGGWLLFLTDNQQVFTTLMASGEREGWVAFHKSDYGAAAQLFRDHHIARARAYLELAILHEDLAQVSQEATTRTFKLWEQKSGIPEGSALPVVAALAAADAGDKALRDQWLAKAKPSDPQVAALASRLQTNLADWTAPQVAEGQLVACVWAHLQARKTGEDLLLGEACPAGPLVTEQATDHLRTFYNPLLHGTEAAIDLSAAGAALRAATQGETVAEPTIPAEATPAEGAAGVEVDAPSAGPDLTRLVLVAMDDGHMLETLLFSPWWRPADLEHDVGRDPSLRTAGGECPSLQSIGVSGPRPKEENLEWARGRARGLRAQLEKWQKAELSGKTSDATQLLDELQLVPQYQSRVLLAWARAALDDDRPHEALVFAQIAVDVERSREITPINAPGIFAVMALADLRTGRTRESLDALQVLTSRFPEVEGLDETIGDLAILEGLDRQGDSKEN
jgi:hypothetical protein